MIDLIEIEPITGSVQAEISAPGSKSITNRALVLAALAEGETTLRGALWSYDTQIMVACLQRLGFVITIQPDPAEASNRTLTVGGLGGHIPAGGTVEQPVELYVANAGTAARFICALVCLGKGVYRLHGAQRMHERPQRPLFQALRQLGYRIDAPNDRLPALVHGGGKRPGRCSVGVDESSQFASALLLSAAAGDWEVVLTGPDAEQSPYVRMTDHLRRQLAQNPGDFQVEPDASSGSYFWAAGWILRERWPETRVAVAHWPDSRLQIDQDFARMWPVPDTLSRITDLGDAIMTAIVIAAFSPQPVRFTDLGRLRVQETERVQALQAELSKCGIHVSEQGDTLTVFPSSPHGAEIKTYGDHRIAMCFATLGLRVGGMRIQDPACVSKTFPDFFQKLALPPPHGLGAVLRDPATSRQLRLEELKTD